MENGGALSAGRVPRVSSSNLNHYEDEDQPISPPIYVGGCSYLLFIFLHSGFFSNDCALFLFDTFAFVAVPVLNPRTTASLLGSTLPRGSRFGWLRARPRSAAGTPWMIAS